MYREHRIAKDRCGLGRAKVGSDASDQRSSVRDSGFRNLRSSLRDSGFRRICDSGVTITRDNGATLPSLGISGEILGSLIAGMNVVKVQMAVSITKD